MYSTKQTKPKAEKKEKNEFIILFLILIPYNAIVPETQMLYKSIGERVF